MRRRIRSVALPGSCLVFTLCALGAFARNAPAADWSHWRGPFQSGFSPEKDLPAEWSPDPRAENNNLIWKAPYGCRSTPLVMSGRVYFINNVGKEITEQERVMCLDADTGKLIWEHKFNVWHTDIVSVRLGWTNLAGDPKTGNVYAHGTQGMLFCFNRDGKVLWSRSLTEEYGRISGYGGRVTSPIVDEDLVIIGMVNSSWGAQAKGANRFIAFNKNTGVPVWWSEAPGVPRTYYSGLVVAVINGERLLISGTSDGAVAALKVRTGELVWNYPFSASAINSSPVVDGNLVYIGHGDENPDNNIQGRVVCLDASQVTNGKPKLVWQKDGVKCRYASPIVHDGLLYVPDDIAMLFCFDARTGKQLWRFPYGRNARGSPVLADGKIYVGEVNSKFHILEPGPKRCKRLHAEFFPSADGVTDVELNGTPAVANGRVYFATSDEFFCIGKKGARPAPEPTGLLKEEPAARGAKATHLQIVPAEVALHPSETATFKARTFDAKGRFLREVEAKWSLPPSPLPTGKVAPPLKGKIDGGTLAVVTGVPNQGGLVGAEAEGLTATARVRVVPTLPYAQDFEKVPDGAVPGGWVNTAGKFAVATLNGTKVLRKVNNKSNPLFARGNAYIGLPTLKDYTIACDVMGTRKDGDMPDIGIVANRYTLNLQGNVQKLRITSWDALPRVDRTIFHAWQPGVWYRLKLTVDVKNGEGHIRGKVWPRDQKEPTEWTVEVTDPRPNTEGAPALYAYVTGIPEGGAGTEIYFDNVRITPNQK